MSKPKVVVLGTGFAGLEAAFYLRHRLHDKVDLTIISDRDSFLFKPNTIYIPFGQDPEKFVLPLGHAFQKKRIEFVQGTVTDVDPDRRCVHTESAEVSYEHLVIATGAGMRAEEIPGLAEHAITVWTPDEMLRLRAALARSVENARAGREQRLLFLVPPNNRCSGPLYEMVLMTDTWLRRQNARDKVHLEWTTYEEG